MLQAIKIRSKQLSYVMPMPTL